MKFEKDNHITPIKMQVGAGVGVGVGAGVCRIENPIRIRPPSSVLRPPQLGNHGPDHIYEKLTYSRFAGMLTALREPSGSDGEGKCQEI